MRPWSRASPDEYRALPLRAHALLADVPLHDVWRVALPGGGPDRTMRDVRAALHRALHERDLPAVVRGLFGIRTVLGRVFKWDDRPSHLGALSFVHRLTEEDLERTLEEPGSPDGPFTTMYVFPTEAASEVRNATVHAFSVMALQGVADGYELFWAIYVRPVGVITPMYMAVINPFRRLLVYPLLLGRLHRLWSSLYR